MRTLANKEPSNQDSAHQKPVKKAPVPIVRSLSTGLPMLQRKHGCACGGGCPRCQSQALLQTKLRIGEPGDKYEQEADRVAEEVMRMPEPKLQRQVEPEEEEEDEDKMVQTKAIVNRVAPLAQRREASEVPTIVREVLNSPGQPLAPETRTLMESCFGHDFNQIRVHTDAKAAESAAEMNAEAYTVKHNIVFATGRYAPDTQPGRQLLAHELTHSLQQSAPIISGMIQRQQSGSAPTSTPCPTTVSIGQIAQFNHSNLSVANQQQFRTYLGAVSRMDVGPGNDHTGHCMKEQLRTVSNTCPAAVYHRNGRISQPCTGNKCLDINRYPSRGVGDLRTKTTLTDGPTSFIDLHRTFNRASLLEGTGVDSCSVICEQIYKCDRTAATTGRFRITRNYRADTLNTGTGSPIHITTGTVTKTYVEEKKTKIDYEIVPKLTLTLGDEKKLGFEANFLVVLPSLLKGKLRPFVLGGIGTGGISAGGGARIESFTDMSLFLSGKVAIRTQSFKAVEYGGGLEAGWIVDESRSLRLGVGWNVWQRWNAEDKRNHLLNVFLSIQF